jgi:hypothetical protein
MPSKKFSAEKEGVKIVKVAAFCFAVVSWFATAHGLNAYVFHSFWLAAFISFGIQGILFVFNLKLPVYFKDIGNSDLERPDIKGIFKKTNFKKILFGAFYALLLASSSWFSFVFIANTVYLSTQYIDANIDLDSNYRNFLNATDKYIDEGVKATQLTATTHLSSLKQEMAPAQNLTEKTKEALEQDVRDAKKTVADATTKYHAANRKLESATKAVDIPDSITWRRQETHKTETYERDNAENALVTAEFDKNEAEYILEGLEAALSDYKPSQDTIVNDFLSEMLHENPDESVLDKAIKELTDSVIALGKANATPANYAAIAVKTQETSIAVKQYLTFRSAQAEDGDFKALDTDIITVPRFPFKKEDEQKWATEWAQRMSVLENVAMSLPVLTGKSTESANDIVNKAIIDEFSANNIANKIDLLVRKHLAEINPMERAVELLRCQFPLNAWFSLLLAFFLDIASLLAGLFIYLVRQKKLIIENSDTPHRFGEYEQLLT